METKEFWYNDNVLVNISVNNRIGVTLYYGNNRQYAIKTSEEIKGEQTKQIKEMLRNLREQKKFVTPLHGCTAYC